MSLTIPNWFFQSQIGLWVVRLAGKHLLVFLSPIEIFHYFRIALFCVNSNRPCSDYGMQLLDSESMIRRTVDFFPYLWWSRGSHLDLRESDELSSYLGCRSSLFRVNKRVNKPYPSQPRFQHLMEMILLISLQENFYSRPLRAPRRDSTSCRPISARLS